MAQDRKITIAMPELNREGNTAQLLLTTDAHPGQILSTAQIVFIQPDGGITFLMYGDYRKTVRNQRGARGTQKNIDNQHTECFTEGAIDGLKGEARAFYAAKRKEEDREHREEHRSIAAEAYWKEKQGEEYGSY